MKPIVLYLDFDGVINWLGSKRGYPQRSGGLGYIQKKYLYSRGIKFTIQYSNELLKRLGEIASLEIIWLSTVHTEYLQVEQLLGEYCPVKWLSFDVNEPYGKVQALLEDQKNLSRPFIWADDEVIPKSVPHLDVSEEAKLLITPDQDTGLTQQDLQAIETFVEVHSFQI